MSKQYQVGDTVRADHGPVLDISDRTGVVERLQDWWVMVKMEKTGIVMPYMEGELTHVGRLENS